VLSVKSRYPSAVGIKPGSTPGGWNTGVAAGDPYGNGYSSAADFGSRIKDEPVEGVESGSSSGLTADLLAVAETFCDDGGPDDSFLPPPDPGPQPWGTLTGIPPCPDQGPHGLTVHLGEEQILEPQRTVQIDLMRHTFIDPSIPVRQMVRRTQTLHLGTAPISWSVSSAFPQVNQGMEVKNVGDSSVFFEVTWGGVISTASLAPGEVAKIAGSTTPTTNFNAMILPITADGMDLEMTELGYEFSFSLGDGTAAPDMHSIQLTHIPEVDDEVLTAYVRGVDDNCGGDTLDLVVRSDGGVPTAIGDPLPVVPTSMQLLPASPNPFNPRTTLRFDLSRPSNVDLRIFDLRGRLVTTLLDNSPYTAGRHEFVWDGTDDTGVQAASGVYIVRMLSGGEQHTGRVTLIK
jgi:hypothetical protein